MGFAVELDGPQKIRLVAGRSGDPLTTFVQGVREGLDRRITSFTVDLLADPTCLGVVMEPLRKLQLLVKSRGQNVTVVGSGMKASSGLARELHKLGVLLPDVTGLDKEPAYNPNAPHAASEDNLISGELEIVFKELDTDLTGTEELPLVERVSPYMKAVQARLAALLKNEEALKKEEGLLLKRLTYLKKREPAGEKSLEAFDRLQEEAAEIDKLRDQIPKLRRELMVAEEAAKNQEAAFKDYSNRSDSENRKKLEVLNKELQRLKDSNKKLKDQLSKMGGSSSSGSQGSSG